MAKKKTSGRIRTYILATAFLLAAVFLYVKWGLGAELPSRQTYETGFVPGFRLEYDYGVRPDVHYFGDGFFFSTKDGLKRYGLDGAVKWDLPLDFQKPRMSGEGGFVMVYESKGRAVSVFSDKGLLYNLSFESEVLSASINNKGDSAVITLSDGVYSINTYNAKGEPSYSSFMEEEGIYPLSADISGDGRVLAVASLNVRGLDIASNVSFYYVNTGESQNYSDGMFGASPPYEGQIIAKISFAGDNKLVYISDSGIGCLETGTQNHLESLWRADINNEINDAAFLGQNALAVAMGKELINKEGYEEGSLVFYNLSTGEIGFEHKFDGPISSLRGGETTLAAQWGNISRNFTGFDQKGNIIWEYNASSDNSRVVALDKPAKIAYFTPISLEILEKGKIPAPTEE